MGEKFISIDNVCVRGRQVVYRFSCSRRISKYFSSDSLYIEYDTPINDVNKSLLTIPAVSVFIPIAWATGANLYLQELDKTYLESLEKIKTVMRNWYPSFSFLTRIVAQKTIANEFHNNEYGLLFSGGLDSMVSYIENRALKPRLISVWGLDVLTRKQALWGKIKETLTGFADKEQVPIHFIKSNVRELINEPLLSVEFGQSWWVRVSHGLITIGLCAPLTTKGIGTILIASTRGPQHHGEERYALGSSPLIDEKISWADIKVVHDCYRLNRQQKIKYILKKFVETEYCPELRVCTNSVLDLNCSQCHKCLHTIAGLVLEGIDPNKCGFRMTAKTLMTLKQSFLDHEYELFEHDFVSPDFIWRTDDWKEIQTEIPQKLCSNLHNSKQFFDWLRNFNLEQYGEEIEKRKANQRLLSVLKYRVLGFALTIKPFFPKTVQYEAKQLTSSLNSRS
jgi:hypothetical protein